MDKEWIAIIHLKKKVYLIDREAYYLLCSLQDVKFGFEDEIPTGDDEKLKMYNHVISWLIDCGKAIKLDCVPHHLIIKFDDE